MVSPTRSEGVRDPPNDPEKPWTKSIEPGHCFVWFNTEKVTLYSTVLPPDGHGPQPGYYRTKTFCHTSPEGFVAYVRDDLPAKLLSEEQMTLARTMGWPNDNDGLLRVLGVQAS